MPSWSAIARAERPASSKIVAQVLLVVDQRRAHRDRTRRCGHLPLGVVTDADHQPPAVIVKLVGNASM